MSALITDLPGHGPHRDRGSAGVRRTRGSRHPGGPGQEHLPQRRTPEPGPHRPGAGPAPRPGGPAPHRPGVGQPPVQLLQELAGIRGDPRGRHAGRGPRRPSPSPTTAGACPPSLFPTCSGSSPGSRAMTLGTAPVARAWGWPSAGGSWRPMGAGSVPKARVWAWAPGSRSLFRWPMGPWESPGPGQRGHSPLPAERTGPAFSSWMMILKL